jgi:diguanylate cyclase (GGDEF)-like protein/PAS domain S-box-containing protein
VDDALRKALSELGIFVKDSEGILTFSNSLWKRIGRTVEELDSDLWLSLLHPDDRLNVQGLYNQLLEGHTDTFKAEYRIKGLDDEYIWIFHKAVVIRRDESGLPSLYVGSDIDITHLKEMEQAISLSKDEADQRALEAETLRSISTVIASQIDAVQAIDLVLAQVNMLIPFDLAVVYQFEEGEFHVRTSAVAENMDLDSLRPGKVSHPVWDAFNTSTMQHVKDIPQAYPENTVFHRFSEMLCFPLIIKKHVKGVLLFLTEHTFSPEETRNGLSIADLIAVALENARLFTKVNKLASTDSLTGLYTRRWFNSQSEKMLEQAKRYNWELSVLMLDIDHFKQVNDRYGHAAGDEALKVVSEICKENFRRSDLICRYGGEEIVILLIQSDHEQTIQSAERLRKEIERSEIESIDEPLTVSIGISCSSEVLNISHIDDLILEADKALYQAKAEGRNKAILYQN